MLAHVSLGEAAESLSEQVDRDSGADVSNPEGQEIEPEELAEPGGGQ